MAKTSVVDGIDIRGLNGEALDYFDRLLTIGAIRVRPSAATGTRPSFDVATTSAFNGISSGGALTFSHTANASATFLLVAVHLSTSTQTVTGITWATTENLFLIGRSANSGNCAVEFWGAFITATGAQNVAVTLSATGIGVVAARTYLDTGGFKMARSAIGNSTTPSISVATWDNIGLVVDSMIVKNANAATAGQTQEYNVTEANGPTRDCGQRANATGGAITMSWTVTSGQWAIIALELRPKDDPSYKLRFDTGADQAYTVTVLPGASDEILLGFDATFSRLRVNVDTAATGGRTLSFKYWNGSAFTAVSGLSDGTNHFATTGENAITWTDPGTLWVRKQIDSGPNLFYIQITISGAPTIAPKLKLVTINWTVFDSQAGLGSTGFVHTKVYKSIGEDGTSLLLFFLQDVSLLGPNSRHCHTRLYETWNSGAHTGTNPAPTVAQLANGATWSKSSSADNVVRNTTAFVDRDKIMVFAAHAVATPLTGSATQTSSAYWGKFTSYVSGDPWNQAVVASNQLTNTGEITAVPQGSGIVATNSIGHYLQRNYLAAVGAVQFAGLGLTAGQGTLTNFFAYPNVPNGGILMVPKRLGEAGAGGQLRGELTDVVMLPVTTAAALTSGTTFTDPVTGFKWWIISANTGAVVELQLAPWVAIRTL